MTPPRIADGLAEGDATGELLGLEEGWLRNGTTATSVE